MKVVAIFGSPRSGTSWLGQIFNSSYNVAFRFQPLFSYEFKSRLSPFSSKIEIDEFYSKLLDTEDEFVLQKKNTSNNNGLTFAKKDITHLVWKEVRYHHILFNLLENSDTKFIGIIRHPCAVINSWLKAPKEFDKSWNPKEEWKFAHKKNLNKPEEFNGYEKWKEIAFLYQKLKKQFPERVFLITYETLNNQTVEMVKEMFDFSEIKFDDQTTNFIKKSKNAESDDPYGVFRLNQQADQWKNELDEEIIYEIQSDEDFQRLKEIYHW